MSEPLSSEFVTKLTVSGLTKFQNLIEEMGLDETDLVDFVDALPAIRAKRKATAEREALRAQALREAAVPVEARIAAEKAKAAAQKIENEKRIKELAPVLAEEERRRKEAEKAEREQLVAANEADVDADTDAYREQEREKRSEEYRKRLEITRAEANRASRAKTTIDRVNRILVKGDARTARDARIGDGLFEELKSLRYITTGERTALKTALKDAAVRFKEAAQKF